MAVKLTPPQTLLLWRILAHGGREGSALQKDLGVEVKPPDRSALEQQGLVQVQRLRNRAVQLVVTDAGWAWASDHLGAELPSRATSRVAKLLEQWLTHFHAYLQRSGATLADVFASPSQGPPPSADAAAATIGVLRKEVRAAYLELTGSRFKTRCLLRDLRARLPHVDALQLDRSLEAMAASGEAALLRLDNRLEITPADSAAAIFNGGEYRHILWIDR